MRRLTLATLLSGSLVAGPAVAQPLFLGSTEIEATDSTAMRMAIEHCVGLAAQAPDADLVTAFTWPAEEAEDTDEDPAAETPPGLPGDESEVDSASEEAIPAGAESADQDRALLSLQPPEEEEQAENGGEEESGNGEGEEPPDLSDVTLDDCKDAGLVF